MERQTNYIQLVQNECLPGEIIVRTLTIYGTRNGNLEYHIYTFLTSMNRLISLTEVVTIEKVFNKEYRTYDYIVDCYDLTKLNRKNIAVFACHEDGHRKYETVLSLPVNGRLIEVTLHSYIHGDCIRNQILNHLKQYSEDKVTTTKTTIQYEAELTQLYKNGIITFHEKQLLLNRFIQKQKGSY